MKRTILLVAVLWSCGGEPTPTPDARVPLGCPLPELPFQVPSAGDFGSNPRFGATTSHRHLLIVHAPDVTELDGSLAAAECTVAGTLPWLRIVQVDCGDDPSFARINRAFDSFDGDPAIETVAYDALLSPTRLPPAEIASEWSYRDRGAWALPHLAAPAAWNLKDAIDETNPALVAVTVMDAGFWAHPDLPPGSYSSGQYGAHGTGVALLIGGRWNGEWIDGVSPYVEIQSRRVHPSVGSAISFAISIETLAESLRSTPARLVNVSLGYNWSSSCDAYESPESGTTVIQRCDPRTDADTGPRVDDGLLCDAADIQASLIAREGRVFGELVTEAAGRTLFVMSAGNDSGPPLVSDVCNECAEPTCPGNGMGFFPAYLSSPFGWAAENGWGADILIVEALDRDGTRAEFSNINGDVFAPGVGILLPSKENAADPWAYARLSGTSFAAPLVAGAAAYLLAIEPTLSNDQLRLLLLGTEHAGVVTFGDARGSETRAKVDLLSAALGIDQLVEGGPGRVHRWLADMDDGSVDGFNLEKIVYRNDQIMNDGFDTMDDRGDGRVDIRDFRRLRDQALLTFAIAPNPKLDLNLDGRIDAGGVRPWGDELFPRAAISGSTLADERRFVGPTELDSLDLFLRVYEPSDEEPWSAQDLRPLMHSADLRFLAGDIRAVMDEFDATGIEILEVTGAPFEPADLPSDLSPLRGITLSPVDRVVTNPLIAATQIRWKLICAAGPVDDTQSHEFAVMPEVIAFGQDVPVSFMQNLPPDLMSCPRTPAASFSLTEQSTDFPQGDCQVRRDVIANVEIHDVVYNAVNEIVGWSWEGSEMGTWTAIGSDEVCSFYNGTTLREERSVFSQQPGCGAMWVETTIHRAVLAPFQTMSCNNDPAQDCTTNAEPGLCDCTETLSYCSTLLEPSIRAGHCFGPNSGNEHWGLPGQTYVHDFGNSIIQHTCAGALCVPLDPIATDTANFTADIEQCYCEWGRRTFPPPNPPVCGGGDNSIYGDLDLAEVGHYVIGYGARAQ